MSTPRRWKNLNDSSISLTTRLTMLTTRLASLTPVSLHAATDGQQGGVDRRRRMEAAGPDASPNVEGVPERPDGDGWTKEVLPEKPGTIPPGHGRPSRRTAWPTTLPGGRKRKQTIWRARLRSCPTFGSTTTAPSATSP